MTDTLIKVKPLVWHEDDSGETSWEGKYSVRETLEEGVFNYICFRYPFADESDENFLSLEATKDGTNRDNVRHILEAIDIPATIEAIRKDVLEDEVEGLKSDLADAVEVAYAHGADYWVKANYPGQYKALRALKGSKEGET